MDKTAQSTAQSQNAPQYGREQVKNGLFQDLVKNMDDPSLMQPLSDAERKENLYMFLKTRPKNTNEIWVFAYGSLIWNPGFEHIAQQRAKIYGYHRRFCLKAFVGRGSCDHFGLLLGLDHGGACAGIAYKIAADNYLQELEILWSREMMGGSYRPIWLMGRSETGQVLPMLSFVIRHDTNRFYPKNHLDHVARQIQGAKGALGSCRDYVYNTHQALEKHAIYDPMLKNLVAKLRLEKN